MKDIKDYFKSSSGNLDSSKTTDRNTDIYANSSENKNVSLQSSNSDENLGTRIEKLEVSEAISQLQENDQESIDTTITPKEVFTTENNMSKNQLEINKMLNDNENFEETVKVYEVKGSCPEKADSEGIEKLLQPNNSNQSALNAFQFLMKSRSKVIGTNSPGKELSGKEESVSDTDHKKLAVQKKLLQHWADSKKDKKRKLDDEEIDSCIKVKLETRKKRFKRLLKVESINEKCSKEKTSSFSLVESKRKTALTKFGNASVYRNSSEAIMITNEDQMDSSSRSQTELKKSLNRSDSKNKSIEIEPKEQLNKSPSSENEFEQCVNENSKLDVKQKNKHKKKLKNCNVISESSIRKPLRQWKMRIKLLDDQILNVDENNIKKEIVGIKKVEDTENEEISVIDNHGTQVDNENIIITDSGYEKDLFKTCRKIKSDKSQMKIKKNENNLKSTSKAVAVSVENESKRILRNRTSLQRPKIDEFQELSSNESSDESFDAKIRKRKALKVAPVFVKAVPKHKVDPEKIEARRKFLLSEMPDLFKKSIQKQESITVPEFDVFPKISHIDQINPEESFFNLPTVKLPIRAEDIFECKYEKLNWKSLINLSTIKESQYDKSELIKNVKTIIRNIKLDNTNYPVHRSYRLLKQKIGNDSNQSAEKTSPSKRNKTKNITKNRENELTSVSEHMWIEKYKPSSSEDMISNFQAVSSLKKWLESWQEAYKNGKKKFKTKIYSSDSESDFISSDAESLLGGSSLTSTIILTGPCGSGKSSSVYAICNELGLNVIELNASSRRTGKQVLQELQEATQSHQVRKNKESVLSFTKQKNPKPQKIKEKHNARKMCVLLIEDVDIVFEQDEGFINAISQISSITKRPIILTTSNEKSIHSQKFMNDFKNIKFDSSTSVNMGIWLQILCLLEGYFVDIFSIGEFLEYNNGDMRKTLLGLQFWIQSGGQMNKRKNFIDNFSQIHRPNGDSEVCLMQTDDDASNISLKEQEGLIDDFRTHSNLISDFQIFQFDRFYDIPLNFDLVKIWWNIPTFLNIESEHGNAFNPRKKSKRNKIKMKMISDMFDSLAWCDVSYKKILFKCDAPVCSKRWTNYLYDSLEIGEIFEEYSSNYEFFFEWNHYMVNGCVNRCKERFAQPASKCQRVLNMALPRIQHKREMTKSYHYEEEILSPVPLSYHLDRKSVSLDYLPALRNIARSEKNRSQNNMKRNNRFYNYLQTLNIKCNSLVLNFATDTLLMNR